MVAHTHLSVTFLHTRWAKSRYTVINYILYTYFWPTLYIACLVLPVTVRFIIHRVRLVRRNTTWLQMAVLFPSSCMKTSHRHLLHMHWALRSTNTVWMICLQRKPVLMSTLHPGTFPLVFILCFTSAFCCVCYFGVLSFSNRAVEMGIQRQFSRFLLG